MNNMSISITTKILSVSFMLKEVEFVTLSQSGLQMTPQLEQNVYFLKQPLIWEQLDTVSNIHIPCKSRKVTNMKNIFTDSVLLKLYSLCYIGVVYYHSDLQQYTEGWCFPSQGLGEVRKKIFMYRIIRIWCTVVIFIQKWKSTNS